MKTMDNNQHRHQQLSPYIQQQKQQDSNPLHDLQKILNEVEEWNANYNTRDERKLYKFTDIETFRVKTIDLSFNDSGELDMDNLQNELNGAKYEYIKIRVPSDADLREINLNIDNNNNNNNNNSMSKNTCGQEKKTIAEYFV